MGFFEGVTRKLNSTGLRGHSAGGNAEDAEQTEEEHTRRSSGGAGGATPRRPRWTLDVRWYAEFMVVTDK